MRFLQWVYRGKLNLYEDYIPNGQYYSRYYYIAKNDGPLAEVKTNQPFGSKKERKKRLFDNLADYPELIDKFTAADDYSFEAINAAIKDYNDFYDPAKTYFVTLRGDTIKCKIAEKIAAATSKDSLAYKTPTAVHFKALDLDSVKEYTFKDALMIRRLIPGETQAKLVNWIERGKLNFYQYINPNNNKSWYVSKGDGPLVLVKGKGSSKQQAQAFSELIADYPELLEQFKGNYDYNEGVVRLTVATYNKMKKT